MTFVYVVTQFVPFFYRSRASGNVPLEIQKSSFPLILF
jgi:hypothetical protein